MLTRDQLKDVIGVPRTLPTDGQRMASVAAIVTFDQRLLFIVRATLEGDPWSGDVAFAGGKVEASDASVMAAAQREVHEELGLMLPDAWAVGALDDINTFKKMIVRPFVFLMPPPDVPPTNGQPADWYKDLAPNHEVAHVFDLPLSFLLAGHGRTTMLHPFRGHNLTMPCVPLPLALTRGRQAPNLWGLTLMIVDNLLDKLDGNGRGLRRPTTPAQDG